MTILPLSEVGDFEQRWTSDSGGTRTGIRIDINFRWRTDRPALQKLEESFLYLK